MRNITGSINRRNCPAKRKLKSVYRNKIATPYIPINNGWRITEMIRAKRGSLILGGSYENCNCGVFSASLSITIKSLTSAKVSFSSFIISLFLVWQPADSFVLYTLPQYGELLYSLFLLIFPTVYRR